MAPTSQSLGPEELRNDARMSLSAVSRLEPGQSELKEDARTVKGQQYQSTDSTLPSHSPPSTWQNIGRGMGVDGGDVTFCTDLSIPHRWKADPILVNPVKFLTVITAMPNIYQGSPPFQT